MPDFNPSMAAGVEVPQFDLGKQLDVYNKAIQTKGLMDYAHALDAGVPMEQAVGHLARVNPELAHKALDEFQRSREVGALGKYSKSGNPQDLRVSPAQYGTAASAETTDYNLGAEQRARKAYELLNEKDPVKKKQGWNDFGEDQVRRGHLDPRDWQKMRDNPSDLVLNNVIRNSMDTQKHMDATGQTAGAKAAAESNVNPREFDPTKRVIIPGQVQGGTPSPVGTITSPGSTPQAGPATPKVAPKDAGKKLTESDYYKEAPAIPIAPALSEGRGVIQPGQHPAVVRATEHAQEIFSKDIGPKVAAASKNNATLGSLQSELESGRVKSDRLMEIKMHAAGFLNGMGVDAGTAGHLLGINLPWTEVMNKDATRMGLSYARETEGAREAVQAIRIALVANPSLTNTVGGNLKIIKMMKMGNDYDIERGKGANAYYKKQQDENGAGHLVNFDTWWGTDHSASQFISKAVPYQLPASGRDLKNGVTYEWKVKDPNTGKESIDPKTREPVTKTGVFNSKTNQFD